MTWSFIVNGGQAPARPYPSGANAVYEENPGFQDIGKLDFSLKPQARLLKDLPGFERIPVEKIGLFLDEYRKQFPDSHATRRVDFQKGEHPGLKYDILDRTN
jgi:hypothetical protein